MFSKRTYPDPIILDLSIPAFDPLPNQYYVRLVSDNWVAVEVLHPISLRNIKMPEQKTPFTDLIDLTPLPTTALQEPKYEQLYSKFDTFNPIQTQLFHTLYHTDSPVFLGAPTGSVWNGEILDLHVFPFTRGYGMSNISAHFFCCFRERPPSPKLPCW